MNRFHTIFTHEHTLEQLDWPQEAHARMYDIMMESVLREARARMREIEQQLSQYQRLVDEREKLKELIDFYEGSRGAVTLFPVHIPLPQANRLSIADRRFHPKADSKTSRLMEKVVQMLEEAPHYTLPFPMVTEMLPEELRPNGESWKEGVRTAIKRAGGRYGVMYETGGVVRLTNRNPQAVEA